MKTTQLILTLASMSSLPLFAAEGEATISEQEIRAIGPLPDDRVAETIRKGERNPFAEKPAAVATTAEDGESENSKLMRVLQDIEITGITKDNEGHYKVLIGRNLLAEGSRMPPLIEGQTSLLRVSKVTEKSVEISWVGDQASATPRKIVKQLTVTQPLITQVIPSLAGGGSGGNRGSSKEESLLRIRVTSKGEAYREEPAEADPAAQTEQSPNGVPPSIDSNHRPVVPSVQRNTHRR
jgi:hypothetical protein